MLTLFTTAKVFRGHDGIIQRNALGSWKQESAGETLSNCAVLIVEAYNFTLCPGCLRFHELCAYLEARGFRCLDVYDILVRPRDQAFWQMDMVFISARAPVFQVAEFR